MNRRTFLGAIAALPLAGVIAAACGDPAQQSSSSDASLPVTTVPPTTEPPTTVPTTISHPTGPNDVILSVAYEGGLVPADYFFTSVPTVLLAGDGKLYAQGAVPAVFPGPLLPTILVAQLDETRIQAMLRLLADAGLLGPAPDYTGGEMVADAANTVLSVNAGGANYVHSAYALGITDPESGPRANLLQAVNRLTELATADGAGATTYVADVYRVRATPVDPTQLATQDPAPTVVDWPVTGVGLAAADDCTRISATDVGSLFIDAKQNTYFRDHDVVYQLAVRGVLPGDGAC